LVGIFWKRRTKASYSPPLGIWIQGRPLRPHVTASKALLLLSVCVVITTFLHVHSSSTVSRVLLCKACALPVVWLLLLLLVAKPASVFRAKDSPLMSRTCTGSHPTDHAMRLTTSSDTWQDMTSREAV
jgi:hypothetical protein